VSTLFRHYQLSAIFSPHFHLTGRIADNHIHLIFNELNLLDVDQLLKFISLQFSGTLFFGISILRNLIKLASYYLKQIFLKWKF